MPVPQHTRLYSVHRITLIRSTKENDEKLAAIFCPIGENQNFYFRIFHMGSTKGLDKDNQGGLQHESRIWVDQASQNVGRHHPAPHVTVGMTMMQFPLDIAVSLIPRAQHKLTTLTRKPQAPANDLPSFVFIT